MGPNKITLPDSDDESPRNALLNSWHPHRNSISTGRSSPYHAPSRSMAWRDEMIRNAEKTSRRVKKIWGKLSWIQRILVVAALVALNVLLILFLIFNERIFSFLEPLAERWKHTRGGWLILWSMSFVAAFPPMIGYSTCGTMAGFVYGVWEGWAILATSTVAGSVCSFVVSRTVLRKWVDRLVANDKRFAAFTLILKHDGLKLLCMIRLCPLPYSISNAALSTFPTIHPVSYAVATALVTPKLFIPVFIGSRLAVIARTAEKMTVTDRLVNYSGIAIGAVVGVTTGWYIYRKTMARAKELEAEEANLIHESNRRTGHIPREFADDPDTEAAAEVIAREDLDAPDYFDESPEDERPEPQYHDDPTDDESDVFGTGDGDEDEPIIANISLHQTKR
ncbi:hypothetical protein B0A52_10306 [Exophiala mesophila]|uniref:Golgi apparatus membrane protein TVP38 n=1 Tax=Exophiala mesophila TaxID=212818 RepID=A0A438MQE1_EXOME|nr:hypothetical protein B0A52_10306 [Exophiala mesophila]